MGNLAKANPFGYLYEAGGDAGSAWMDGRVSADAEKEAVEIVMKMPEELLTRIMAAEVILVSPLARTLGTCIIVLLSACGRLGLDPSVLMEKRFMVVSELREKVSSPSDIPGSNPEDNRVYIKRTATTYGESLFKRSAALDAFVEQVVSAYNLEQMRSKSRNFGKSDAKANAKTFEWQINLFRERLDGIQAKRVFIVGHNGWSRWAFSARLLPPCFDQDVESPDVRLAFGGRQVRELNNLGVLTASFSDGSFKSVSVPNLDYVSLPICVKKTKFGFFTDIDQAKAADLIHSNAQVHRILAEKAKKDTLVTFSAGGSHSFLAWGNNWGEPQYFIDLLDPSLMYACDGLDEADPKDMRVHIAYAKQGVFPGYNVEGNRGLVKPFALIAKSKRDFLRLCNLLTIHIKFGRDADFVGQILNEDGWDTTTQYVGDVPRGIVGPWERKWELSHRSHSPGDFAEPESLRKMQALTDDLSLFREIQMYEEDGMNCTKVKILGFTFAEWC